MSVAQKDEIMRLRHRIAELEAERDSIRDEALEEAALLSEKFYVGKADMAPIPQAIRALKGTKP